MRADPSPTLLMLAGMPGTGKSTLAAALHAALRWPVLDKDVANAALLAAQLAQSSAAPLAYEVTFAFARALVVEQRQSIILDTAGRQPFILTRATQMTQEAQGQLVVVQLVAPLSVRQSRLSQRSAGPSQWQHDSTPPEQERAWYAHLPSDRLVLDATQPVHALVAQVCTALQGS